MKQRGRKVNNDLAVIEGSVNERPEPPAEIDVRAAEVWNRTVTGMPASWYSPPIRSLLIEYCRQVVILDNLNMLLEQEGLTPKEYMQVCRQRAEQFRTMMMAATKLRITPQSTLDPDKLARAKSRKATGAKPWERKK